MASQQSAKPPLEISKFRDMVSKQTEELGHALQQRSEYERRLTAAETELQISRDKVQLMEEEVAQRDRRLHELESIVREYHSRDAAAQSQIAQSQLVIEKLVARADQNAARAVAELQENEREDRSRVERQEWFELWQSAEANPVQFVEQFARWNQSEISNAAARKHVAMLVFQLRVATPIRVRNALNKVDALTSALQAANDKIAELQIQADAVHTEHASVARTAASLEREVSALRQELSQSAHSQLSELREVEEKIRHEAEVSRQAHVDAMALQLEQAQEENEEYRRQVESHSAELNALVSENERLHSELESYKAASELQTKNMQTELKVWRQRAGELGEALENEQEKCASQRLTFDLNLAESEKRVKAAESRVKELEIQLANSSEQCRQACAQVQHLEAQQQECLSEMKQLRDSFTNEQQRIDAERETLQQDKAKQNQQLLSQLSSEKSESKSWQLRFADVSAAIDSERLQWRQRLKKVEELLESQTAETASATERLQVSSQRQLQLEAELNAKIDELESTSSRLRSAIVEKQSLSLELDKVSASASTTAALLEVARQSQSSDGALWQEEAKRVSALLHVATAEKQALAVELETLRAQVAGVREAKIAAERVASETASAARSAVEEPQRQMREAALAVDGIRIALQSVGGISLTRASVSSSSRASSEEAALVSLVSSPLLNSADEDLVAKCERVKRDIDNFVRGTIARDHEQKGLRDALEIQVAESLSELAKVRKQLSFELEMKSEYESQLEREQDSARKKAREIADLQGRLRELEGNMLDIRNEAKRRQEQELARTEADTSATISRMEQQLAEERSKCRALMLQLGDLQHQVSVQESAARRHQSVAESAIREREAVEHQLDTLFTSHRQDNIAREAKHAAELQAALKVELDLRKERTALEADNKHLQEQAAQLASSESQLLERNQKMQTRMSELTEEMAVIRSQLEDNASTNSQAQVSTLMMKRQVEEAQAAAEAARTSLLTTEESNSRLLREVSEQRNISASLEAETVALKRQIAAHQLSLSTTSEDYFKAVQELNESKKSLVEAGYKEAQLMAAVEALKEENASLQGMMGESVAAVEVEVRAFHVEVSALRQDRDAAYKTIAQLQAEKTQLLSNLASQKESVVVESLAAVEGFRAQLLEKQRELDETQREAAQLHRELQSALESSSSLRRQLILSDETVKELRSEVGACQEKVSELVACIASKDTKIDGLDANVESLTCSISQLEVATRELLQEKQQELESCQSSLQQCIENLNTAVEREARAQLRLSESAKEHETVCHNMISKIEATESEMKAMEVRHSNSMLEMETMAEEFLRQAADERHLLQKQVVELRASVQQLISERDEAREKMATCEGLLKESDDNVDRQRVKMEALESNLRQRTDEITGHLEQIKVLEGKLEKHRDMLELEKASHHAEEEGLRRETTQVRQYFEVRCKQLEGEIANERQLREHMELQLMRIRSADDEVLQHATAALEDRHRATVDQLNELRQAFARSEQKAEESSRILGATSLEVQTLRQTLRHKEEDLAAAILQASDAADTLHAMERRVVSAEARCVDLSKALVACQRELGHARDQLASLEREQHSSEEALELRWQRRLDHHSESCSMFVSLEQEASLEAVRQLEAVSRMQLVQLHDELRLAWWCQDCVHLAATHLNYGNARAQRLQAGLLAEQQERQIMSLTAKAQFDVSQLQRNAWCDKMVLSVPQLLGERALLLHTVSSAFATVVHLQSEMLALVPRLKAAEETVNQQKKQLREAVATNAATTEELSETRRQRDAFGALCEKSAREATEAQIRWDESTATLHRAATAVSQATRLTRDVIVSSEVSGRNNLLAAFVVWGEWLDQTAALLADSQRERLSLVHTRTKAEAIVRSEVDHMYTSYHDRLERMTTEASTKRRELQIHCLVIEEELVARHRLWQEAVDSRQAQLWPKYFAETMTLQVRVSNRELGHLRHALAVAQRECGLLNQRANTLADLELASCRSALQALQKRRHEDLMWIPVANHRHVDAVMSTRGNGKDHPLECYRIATDALVDVEQHTRMILVRLAVDALHGLHMCLLMAP